MTPLVYAIIPTFNRPQSLHRRVENALAGMEPDEVEVIVVAVTTRTAGRVRHPTARLFRLSRSSCFAGRLWVCVGSGALAWPPERG